MASVNKAIVVGNVGRDAEFKDTKGGGLLTFSVATTEKWKNGEDTQWHNVKLFGKLAEAIRDYVVKGRQIYVEGKIKTEEWTDKDGNKRKSTYIDASFGNVMLLGKGDSQKQAQTVETSSGPVSVPADDDVPF